LRYSYWAILAGLIGATAVVQRQTINAEHSTRWWQRPIAL
jgi:hypothetical protein